MIENSKPNINQKINEYLEPVKEQSSQKSSDEKEKLPQQEKGSLRGRVKVIGQETIITFTVVPGPYL